MAKAKLNDLKPLGNENSYTPEFFSELCEKINLTDRNKKADLGRHIILAAQKYMSQYGEYQRQLAAHEVEKELGKVASYIGKAQDSLWKVTLKENSQKTPLKAIREKCLDCCGYQCSEVRECHIRDCPLWPYRMGKNPFHQRNMTDEQKQAATQRLKGQEKES